MCETTLSLRLFVNKLPLELEEMIRKYTYKPQKSNLLEQIVNFKKYNDLLQKIYFSIYNHELENDSNAVENWIDNDISLFLNENRASMYGYVDKIYDFFSRNIIFNNKEKIEGFLDKVVFLPAKTAINIYIGLITKKEMNEFLKYITNIYNLNDDIIYN